jgi:hypothetical protein
MSVECATKVVNHSFRNMRINFPNLVNIKASKFVYGTKSIWSEINSQYIGAMMELSTSIISPVNFLQFNLMNMNITA